MFRLLTFSTLFPNTVQPNHGVFVETRLRQLAQWAGQGLSARVVAPVPWFPVASRRLGRYGKLAFVPRQEERHGFSVFHPGYPVIPKIGMNLGPLLLYRACLPLFRRLRDEQDFDLIDAHYFYPDGVAAIWLGKALGKPVVITARGTDVNLIPNYSVPRRMITEAAAEAAGIVAVSRAIKDALLGMGVPDKAVTVLRNGVDLALFHPGGRNEARLQLGLSGPVLASVGHLIERKGHHHVIAAMTELPNYSLLVVGEGPDRQRLGALVSRLGLTERVRFLGAIPHQQLRSVYAAVDLLVLASSREGWPNVLLEAMACGTAVVASNVWGNPEVVGTPVAGRLMEETSPAGVARAVRALLADPPLRGDTRRYAEEFSWDATSQGQMDLFAAVLAGTRAHAA